MAPFDSELTTKISPLIDGQVPDFIQADHPVFVEFLKAYYQFLESAEMTISGTVDQILLETVSANYLVLDGTNLSGSNNEDRIVFEIGSGGTGKFDPGETITGSISKATSIILVDDDERIFIKANTRFVVGEIITGSTSGAVSTIIKYRANPVQTIQQLLDYANPDNTVDHFFTAFRDSFMESIPENLADGVSKRLLIKQIRDLYSAKGTSEGHKLFFRMLLGEEANITYPQKYMMRLSDGKWNLPTIIRCTADTAGTNPNNIIGQSITGASSKTIAQIISINAFNQGTDSVVEFGLRADSILGDGFSVSETFTGIDTVLDVQMQFTIQSIIISATVNDAGLLNNVGDLVNLDSDFGNGLANASVSTITTGSVSDIYIETAGNDYEIGDGIKFIPDLTDSLTSVGKAFVSVTGGRLITEDSTTSIPEFIINEEGTVTQFVEDKIILNGTAITGSSAEPFQVFGTDRRFSDTQSYYYPLYITESRASNSNIVDGETKAFIFEEFPSLIFWMPTNNQNTTISELSTSYDLFVSVGKVEDEGFSLRQENQTTGTGLGDNLLSESESLRLDSYSTASDGVIIEPGVFTPNEASEINRIFIANGGNGYSKLPKLTVTSRNGNLAELISLTNDIGKILEVEIKDNGFKYNSVPVGYFNSKLILGDVVGSFSSGTVLQNQSGNVVSWEADTRVLTIDGDPRDRINFEQDEIYNEKVRLENFDIVEPGRPDHGQIGQIYNVQEEVDSHFQLNAYQEIESPIKLEDEIGFLDSNGFSINIDQLSLERDLNIPIEFGIRLESGSVIPSDEDGKFLLNNHLTPLGTGIRRDGRTEFHFIFEDDTVGVDTFGNQIISTLLFDNVEQDSGDNIRLEEFKFRLEVETSVADSTDPHGTFIVFEDNDQVVMEDGTEQSGGGSEDIRFNSSRTMLEDATELTGNFLLINSTDIISGDKLQSEFATNIQAGNNTDSIILEDSIIFNGSPSYLVNEDYGNALIYNDDTRILFEIDEAPVEDTVSSYGQSIKHSNTTDPRLIGEGLETFITENSDNADSVLYKENGKLIYNNVTFDFDDSKTDGDDRPGLIVTEDGDTLLNEISGDHGGITMILDGTNLLGEDAGGAILHEDEQLNGSLILNASAIDTDISDSLILEQKFALLGETISDGVNSGLVLAEGISNIIFNIGTTATNLGNYINTDSLLGPSINRIQDSYFYQQFSYEVSVGSVLSEYINELKRAVHPAGFIPFGKVSLSSLIGAAAGVADEDADAAINLGVNAVSALSAGFDETLRMSHEVRNNVLDTTGGSSLFDTIILENGVAIGDLLLEETDGDNLQFEGGLNIAVENSQSSGDGTILLDFGIGGRLLTEDALGESANRNRSITHITTITVTPDIVIPRTTYGAPLASLPGSIFFDGPSIQLEDGMRNKLPAIMQDNLILDGTDIGGNDAGDKISYEIDLNFNSGIPLSALSSLTFGDLNEIDTVGFTEPAGTLKTTEGAIVFEESSASDDLVLEAWLQFITEDGDFIELETETDTGYLIGPSIGYAAHNINIVLDGTNVNTGKKLVTEGSMIEFEDNTNQGSIPEGNFGNRNIAQFTRAAKINSKSATDKLSLQDDYTLGLNFALEDDSGILLINGTSAILDIGGNIILEGTDSGKTDEGDFLIMDRSAASTDVGDNIILDSTGGRDDNDKFIFQDTIYLNVVGAEGGSFLLDGTDNSGTNAGDDLLVEDGLFNFLQQNSINLSEGISGESGGLQLPISEISSGEDGAADISTFDSISGTLDSTTITFDAV